MSLTDTTIIITAWQEPHSLAKALQNLLPQSDGAEIIVVAPDEETLQVATSFEDVQILQDEKQGKPVALNLALAASTRSIVVLTDGDVYVHPDALHHLLLPFEDDTIGAVSGRPISTSDRKTMLGFWSHLLTDAGAHTERSIRDEQGQFLVCSGYLYAFRRELVDHIPSDALAEDAVVSHHIGHQGYRIRYAPQAEVYVVYPTTYRDWLIQKVRSAGGYAQPIIADSSLQMRSFWHEVRGGLRALTYGRTPREFIWTLLLYLARLHLWLLIFWRVKILNTPLTTMWKRVESTKAPADQI